ncbi:nucleotidyltransferase domain-containing protein [Microbacterium sp. 4R-513]|uniref:nucleotidyltransferase family protein n=1 Tax=Microbacterium sp. 4R-513 TaxID=2567934 RepID=UPI0013E152CC|nr:nucleotidyltransferase domain-containing protein [Microbacterium sp. 4R-513]QIG40415.1 nucleotidyltransferase domain-containing protein [Microbacterium sp. 4R-513]
MFTEQRLREMAEELCGVRGVRAVALGGSRARGTDRPDSDFDLGVYYDGGVDLSALEKIAARWSGSPVSVAAPGQWGDWVDGGAWLVVDGVAVDWILRDVGRVAEQCERAVAGRFAFHTQAGHPLGFLDVSYAGEVALCVPLCDEEGLLKDLADRVTPYPAPLREALLQNLWQVDFLLDNAEKGARSTDVAYVALCLTTTAMRIAHAWHAVAGQWVVNEKGLVPNVARLNIDTGDFCETACAVLGAPGATPEALQASITALRNAARP